MEFSCVCFLLPSIDLTSHLPDISKHKPNSPAPPLTPSTPLHPSPLRRHQKWLHRSAQFISVPDRDRPQTFQDVGRELLGKSGEKVIIVFVVLMQLGICTVFFNYAAENLIAVSRKCLLLAVPEDLTAGIPCALVDMR